VLDPRHIARLDALLRETMERTGGTYHPQDWAGMLDLARRQPELARIVGVFRSDAGPDALLAYAVGLAHGDHVQYATAASTRATDLKLPLGYGPAWELMRWARSLGMRWFDFGGIAASSREGRLGGINDFKRYFRGEETDVADEWAFEPHPMRAALANTLSAAASWWRERSRNGAIVRALS
jgi:lipid II:glycine glycyltransferase (peptidoglycan interpeptide bridge formation enzyme)